MATATSSPPDVRTAGKPKRDRLAESKVGLKLPVATLMYGPAGLGKSSLGAAAPKPIFMVDDQELGIHTLIASGAVESVPVMPACQTWTDVLETIAELRTGDHDRESLVIDTIGGLQSLCFDYVRAVDFQNDRKKFVSYGNGVDSAVPIWRDMLRKLDALRIERRMRVILLGHSTVKTFKNPEGEDYDRYSPAVDPKIYAATGNWCDMVLFCNFHTSVDESGKRPKGKGGQMRFFNTEYCPAYEAKNRYGLPTSISMGSSGSEAWGNLIQAITEARAN